MALTGASSVNLNGELNELNWLNAPQEDDWMQQGHCVLLAQVRKLCIDVYGYAYDYGHVYGYCICVCVCVCACVCVHGIQRSEAKQANSK